MADTKNSSTLPSENWLLKIEQPKDQKKMGWVSPQYTISRTVKLDTETILENRCLSLSAPVPEMEAYRLLRSLIIRRSETDGGNTLMITSAIPGEGKTLTSINLALTFAMEFSHTVFLVDCDLRQQNIHKVMGYESNKGLANYFIDSEPLPNLIVWPSIEKMTVISGGKTINKGSEFLGSPGMKSLVEDIKNRYPDRFIIFDVPPVLSVADALALVPYVDYIIVVVRSGYTPARDIKNAIQMLPKEKVLGMVLNGQKPSPKSYYAGYYPEK
jgi:non-specific protein-tyrosine kinase